MKRHFIRLRLASRPRGLRPNCFLAALLVFVFLAGCKKEAPAEEKKSAAPEKHETGVHLTKEQQAAAGLAVAKPEPMELKPETKAFGRVLDVAPLAALLAEIESGQSAVAASAKEVERLKSLGDTASARALETAEAAAARDRSTLEGAQARLIAGWGKPLTTRPDLAALTRSLLAQEAALIRVDVPGGDTLPSAPIAVRIAPLAGDARTREAALIGPAPNTDPQVQGQAFLALTRDPAWPPGTAVVAWLACEGAAKNGFRLPRTAIVQHESEMFVFVQTGDESFERKRVEIGKSDRDGAFVAGGVTGDDRVVVSGAQQVLSEELKGAAGAE